MYIYMYIYKICTWLWRALFCFGCVISSSLQWRHNGHDGVSNHQPRDCLLNLYSGTYERKHQSSASLAFLWGIHRRPVNSQKGPVTRKMFPFNDVIMYWIRVIHLPNLSATRTIKCDNFFSMGPPWTNSTECFLKIIIPRKCIWQWRMQKKCNVLILTG